MKIATYTIYCKVCKQNKTYDIDWYDQFDHVLTGLGHLYLNCHACNDYAVYIGGKCIPATERYRYDGQRTKENIKLPIQFSFQWRYE